MSATPEPSEHLPFFVYGTLLPGQPNAHLWAERVVAQEVGWLANGRLYDLGSFPIMLEEGDEFVRGVVLYVAPAQYQAVLARLDELERYDPAQPEAAGYRRVAREVRVENGRCQTAWVYIGQGIELIGFASIPGGDWSNHIANRLPQIEAWWQEKASSSHLFDKLA